MILIITRKIIMAEDKVKNFITVFDETINNSDKIKTPEEINKTFESLQRVTDELLTENNLVIDPDTLMRYNDFLVNEAVIDCGKLSKIDENFFNYGSYPSCFNGKGEGEIITSINSILGSCAREVKIFGCLRGFLSFDIWKNLNSIEEWASKELIDENSITNQSLKYFKLLNSFLKLLYNLKDTFKKKTDGYGVEDKVNISNLSKIQMITLRSFKYAVFTMRDECLWGDSGTDYSDSKFDKIRNLEPSEVDDLFSFPCDSFYYFYTC
jgi:hypothetical protein